MGQYGEKWGNRCSWVKKGRELTEIILKERPTVSIEQLVQLLIKLKYDLIEEDCQRREILMAIQELLEKLLLEGKL